MEIRGQFIFIITATFCVFFLLQHSFSAFVLWVCMFLVLLSVSELVAFFRGAARLAAGQH